MKLGVSYSVTLSTNELESLFKPDVMMAIKSTCHVNSFDELFVSVDDDDKTFTFFSAVAK